MTGACRLGSRRIDDTRCNRQRKLAVGKATQDDSASASSSYISPPLLTALNHFLHPFLFRQEMTSLLVAPPW
jgi:hypothetical protein